MPYDKEEWRANHSNGQIPLRELAAIVPTNFDTDLNGPAMMQPEAAAAMSALLAAAHADGITELHVTYSYRTLAKQREKWANYIGPDGIIDTEDDGNLAAVIGTSNHGWAVSCDMGSPTDRSDAWLRNNAQRFGFVNDVASEDWHWTYQEHIWNGDTGEVDDVKQLDAYIDAQQKCVKRYKDRQEEGKEDPDPGAAPDGMDDPYAIKGWNIMRAALNNPK